jgi:hypothetical protein
MANVASYRHRRHASPAPGHCEVDADGARWRQPNLTETLRTVQEGMNAAVSWGSAHRGALKTITVAGKTGTAEFPG